MPDRDAALASFYERWQHEPLVVNKWFALQAMIEDDGRGRARRGPAGASGLHLDQPQPGPRGAGRLRDGEPAGLPPPRRRRLPAAGRQGAGARPAQPAGRGPPAGGARPLAALRPGTAGADAGELERVVAVAGLSRDAYEIASKSLADDVGRRRGRGRSGMKDIGHLIGGRHNPGVSGQFAPVFNPALGEQTGRVALGGAAEVDAAVQAALQAQPDWAATPLLRRMRVMFKLKELLERDLDRLAGLVTAEHGKTLEDAKGSVTRGHRGGRVRLRPAAADEGRVQPPGRRRRRSALGPPSGGRVRRHHAVQLPGHGAAVDGPAGDRLRQRLHPQAVREATRPARWRWPS